MAQARPKPLCITRRSLFAAAGAVTGLALAAPCPVLAEGSFSSANGTGSGTARTDQTLPQGSGPALGRVVDVPSADRLVMEEGRVIRLAGIDAARPPAGSPAGSEGGSRRRWPLAEAARAALSDLVRGKLLYGHGRGVNDRHERLIIHALLDDGVWLQGRLLAAGHARVRTRPDQTELIREMLTLEDSARQAGLGIWGSRVFAVRKAVPAALARDIGSFQIIEGRVLAVGLVDGGAYLNFGEDWRRDVTVQIERTAMRRFTHAGLLPAGLEGQVIRVRGWVEERNGPLIRATHPEQIEQLTAGLSPG